MILSKKLKAANISWNKMLSLQESLSAVSLSVIVHIGRLQEWLFSELKLKKAAIWRKTAIKWSEILFTIPSSLGSSSLLISWRKLSTGCCQGEIVFCSVGDPDPDPDLQDPHVFGPPASGSGTINQRYGSRSGSFPFLEKALSKVLYNDFYFFDKMDLPGRFLCRWWLSK